MFGLFAGSIQIVKLTGYVNVLDYQSKVCCLLKVSKVLNSIAGGND